MSLYRIAIPIQLRYSDTDMNGHINNCTYVNYVETARLEYFVNHVGFNFDEENAMTVQFEIEYKRPAKLTDKVVVLVRTEAIGNSSMSMEYAIVDEKDQGKVFAQGKVKQVVFSPMTGKPIRVSDRIRKKVVEIDGLTPEEVFLT